MILAINDAAISSSSSAESAEWPLRFKRHNVGTYSFSTYRCKIVYDGFLHIDEPENELQPSSNSYGPDYKERMNAGYLGVRNFPSPALVTWRSKDGTPHRAEVDMAAIFKDEVVLHNVPKNDVEEHALKGISDPGIILEVNDRTINVYMKAFIPTNSYRIPGNKHSNYRDD